MGDTKPISPPAPILLSHLSYLGNGIAAIFIAYSLAWMVLSVPIAVLGHSQLEAPLLFAVIASTCTTMMVSILTTRGILREVSAVETGAKTLAGASHMFANSVGTLTIIVGQLVITVDTGWRTKDLYGSDALSLLLGLTELSKAEVFVTYLVICVLFALISFWLIGWGARLFSESKASESQATLGSFISITLLTLSILIGYPWKPAPLSGEGLGVAISLAATLATIFLLIFIGIIVAQLLTFATIRLSVLWSIGALKPRANVSGSLRLELTRHIVTQAARGLLVGALLALLGWGGFMAYGLLLEEWGVISDDQTHQLWDAYFVAAEAWWRFIFLATPVALLMAMLALAARPTAAMSMVTLRFTSRAFTDFPHIVSKFGEAVSLTIAKLGGYSRDRQESFSFSERRSESSRVESPTNNSDKNDALNPLSAPLNKALQPPQKSQWQNAVILVGCLSVFVLISVYLVTRSNDLVTAAEPTFVQEPETERTPLAVAPPGYEFARPIPVSLCEPPVGGFNWSLNSTETIETPLQMCRLPHLVSSAEDGVLIIVSVASTGTNQAAEIELAIRRGLTAAHYASYRTAPAMPIYILNLGMALNSDAFTIGWRQFGAIVGERPVLALLIRPYPEGTVVPVSDILLELSNNLSMERVVSSFTNCELLRFEPDNPIAEQLVPVPEFSCTSR